MKNSISEVKANKTSVPYGILFLILAIVGIFLVGYPIYTGEGYGKVNYMMIAGILAAPFGFIGFLRSCYTSKFDFDIEGGRYRHVDGYGPFKSGQWRSIGKIEYVSVFRQFYADQEWENEKDISIAYTVNLWHSENRNVTLTTYTDKLSAFKFAERLAIQLNIGLLDSTEPNDYKWVELETEKMVY
jgi:hypothetical protein